MGCGQNKAQNVGKRRLKADKMFLRERGRHMGWVEGIGEAVRCIEENISGELTIGGIAKRALMSPYYFQKGFAMLCGMTVGEYIRQRRLTLAGSQLVSGGEKVIDIALQYGYDSPDSFTKAFTRFHGATPTAVRKEGAMVRSLAPLTIKLSLEGGYLMDYRITQKEAFTLRGVSKVFRYDTAFDEIPGFWAEHVGSGEGRAVCGMYGVCLEGDKDAFEYLIADDCDSRTDTPEGLVTKTIPGHTWAVFACRGALPNSLQEVNRRIFSQWLPGCKEYEIASGINIEMYSDPSGFPRGNQDENYYSEIWIPVRKK